MDKAENNILIVDDIPENLKVLSDILKKTGFMYGRPLMAKLL